MAIVFQALKRKRGTRFGSVHDAAAVGQRLHVLDGVEELAGRIGSGFVVAAAPCHLGSALI
jgi:hypothetical protein